MIQDAVRSTTMVIVTPVPLARVSNTNVTVYPVRVGNPWVEVAETKATPGGSLSVKFTNMESEGPLFLTTIV
jgi:hypothetical protein